MTFFVRKNMQNSQKNKIAYRLQLLITIQNGKHNENSYLVLIVFFSPPRLRHRPPIPITHLRKFFKVLPRNTFLEPVTQKIIHPHMQPPNFCQNGIFSTSQYKNCSHQPTLERLERKKAIFCYRLGEQERVCWFLFCFLKKNMINCMLI